MSLGRVAVLVGLSLVPLSAAGTTSAQSQAGSLSVIVNQVLALFPKVEGEVIEVQGKSLTLSLGRRDGLQAGIELSVYREGRELKHPKTGELLGRAEQELGRVSVTEVLENYSTGTLRQAEGVRPGDKVRVSAGKVKVTVLPLLTGVKESLVEAAVHELVNALTQTGRFQVLLGDQVGVWLAQERIPAEEFLEGKGMETVSQRFKVEHLLAIHFKRVQNKPFMEVRFLSLPRTEPLLTTSLFVPASIKPAAQGQFSASTRPAPSGPKRAERSFLARILGGEMEAGTYSSGPDSLPLKEIARFAFPVLGMDVAVAPKDGIPRVVVTDGQRLFLYRLVNQVLEPEWTYTRTAGLVLSVQLADLDGDGALEVVVNQHHRENGLTGTILATRDGRPERLAEESEWVLLAVDNAGDGVKRTLWGQRYSADSFFSSSTLERLAIRKGSLVSEGRIPIPPGFRAIGATLSNITGKGTRALAFTDDYQRLQVVVDGQEMWRSSTPVGGGYVRAEIFKQIERGGRSYFYTMEPYPLSVDLDGDGVEEIVVPQNRQEGFLAVVYRGPAGLRLQSINSGHEGAITALGAIPGSSAPAIIASVVRFKNFMKTAGETQIIMTSPE